MAANTTTSKKTGGIKLQKFLGKMPRIAPELIPDMYAQVATNVKLSSGDLKSYKAPHSIARHGMSDKTPKTLYALYHPDTGAPVWFVWDSDVDIVTPSGTHDEDKQRFYYTGDGKPKVSTYILAVSGSSSQPNDYYELGLPLPETAPTIEVQDFESKSIEHISRNSSGVVTIRVPNHGLKTGAYVTVSGYTKLEGRYQKISTHRTVVYIDYSNLIKGSKVVLTFISGGEPSGVFTVADDSWSNRFDVHSNDDVIRSGSVSWDISSMNAVSTRITVKDANTFTIRNPGFGCRRVNSDSGYVELAGDKQARSYLYTWFTGWEEESIGSEPSKEEYMLEGQVVHVKNLPQQAPPGKHNIQGLRLYRTLSTVSDTEYMRIATLWFPVAINSVSTDNKATSDKPHNLGVGDYIKISHKVAGAKVTDVIDAHNFKYTGGTAISSSGDMLLFHDISNDPGTDAPRYWGDGSFDVTDDYPVESLRNALVTDDYDPPPENLRGLVSFNTSLAGFVGNSVYFSEPKKYYAWPRAYKKEIPYDIVGLAVFSGYLLVLTDNYPYLVYGNDPETFSITRIDAQHPCLNKRSIVNMGYGVVYATHGGLALYSTTTGPQIATRLLYDSYTWNKDLDPETLVATAFDGAYFAWHSAGGISYIYQHQNSLDKTKQPGSFVDLSVPKSKLPTALWYDVRSNQLYFVVGGNDNNIYIWDDVTSRSSMPYTWRSKVIHTDAPGNIGVGKIDANFKGGVVNFGLWVDGVLIAKRIIRNNHMFRLPCGYRSDTFEVTIQSTARVKTVYLASTPTSLKEV